MNSRKSRDQAPPGAKMSKALARISALDVILDTDAERVIVNLRPSGHCAFTVFAAATGDKEGGVFVVES